MNSKPILFRPWALGLAVTLLQICIAVVLIAPEGPLSFRYDSLVQHDSYWFANIVDRGYETTVPPISHKMMEVSNVAFFPAYPAIAAAILHYGLRLSIYNALLITAQAAAWGFWSYFFLFCERWNISPLLQFFGALSILAHPTAFFLVAAYSESLFMMGLFGFMFWSTAEGKGAKALAVLHGFLMSATRIVGIPCAGYPVVQAVFQNGWRGLADVRSWIRRYGTAILMMLGATMGRGRLLSLLPPALGAMGYLHAHPAIRLGDHPRLSGGVQTFQLPMAHSGVEKSDGSEPDDDDPGRRSLGGG